MFGFKSRLDTLQAAILDIKLKHLKEFTQKRRQHAEKYKKVLSSIPQISLPTEMDYAHHVYHVYAIQAERRNELSKFLEEKGIKTVIHYPIPIHLQEVYGSLGFKKGDFPVSERLSGSILSLPMFPELTNEEIEYISEKIHEFYR